MQNDEVLRLRNKKLLGLQIKRGAVIAVALVLVFDIAKTGATELIKYINSHKTFDTNYRISPLESETQQPLALMSGKLGESISKPRTEEPRKRVGEIESERSAFSSTFLNNDSSRTMEYSIGQQNYLDKDGKWKKIDNSLTPTKQIIPDGDLAAPLDSIMSAEQFNGKAGDMSVTMNSLNSGVKINAAGKTINMKPIGANNAKPEKTSESSILYKDAWPNVDIEYELRGESVKEIIILKDKDAGSKFVFNVAASGKVIPHPTRSGELAIEGMPEEYSFSALTLHLQDRGVISEERVTQAPAKDGGGIEITMDAAWLRAQPDSSFPMRIDPTYTKTGGDYYMYKSDGYTCNRNNCYANTGSLKDSSWKNWRTLFHFPYSNLANKKILDASLMGIFKHGIGGNTTTRTIRMGHATCKAYSCPGQVVGSTRASTDFTVSFTAELQRVIDAKHWGATWSILGEEGAFQSYKPYSDFIAHITYDTPSPAASPSAPADKQVVVTTQPSLKVSTVVDADGDTVQYYFRVSTKPDAETGAVINSGWINSPEWSIPDGILQDGTTYYWHTYTRGATQTNPNWVRSFRVDLRTGKDSTQSYDTVGPVGVDLATGNATLATGTHSMGALGGDIGLNLSYDTPNRAKQGLKGEYWNIPANYSFASGPPNTAPKLTRRDQNIDFNWTAGSPATGINSDWFYARWTGQFVAPVSGTYQFGGIYDDDMRIIINSQTMFDQAYVSACRLSACYDDSKSIALSAGQVVPISVHFREVGGGAHVKLYVKGAMDQRIIPAEWLYADLVNEPQSFGLTGHYYVDTGDKNIDTAIANSASRLMMVRQDTNLNFNLEADGPAPGLYKDNFLVRWTGYITVPEAGSYKLGALADDAVRIRIKNGNNWTNLLDSWSYVSGDRWGSAVTLPANIAIPISIDYREDGGGAVFYLKVQNPANEQINVPTTWLTPNADILPTQWKLGLNSGGAYQRLRITGNSAVLEDSTGSTHEYTYTNGGYKPPKGEDGTLTKNSDNTYTLVDTSGYVYIFDAEGKLTSLTSPVDAKKPAAVKYIYAGDPARLIKIEDGVTNARYANVYYKGINDPNSMCDPNSAPNSPGTFFGLFAQFDQAPNGMLCAFETSDGKVTNFYYKNGLLARVVHPGSIITDYAYDSLGRITAIRDPLAADTIGAGVRADDDSVVTQLTYDSLGRIHSVKAPAATASAARLERTFSYGIGQTDLHLSGASEPNGFSRRIKYDSLLRTTMDTDLTGKSMQTEWDAAQDLVYSTTDPTGQKSTTIYDDDDRPIESYGPAPAAWYGSDRKPLQNYASQIPHTSTAYDQGIKGPAVTWYNLKSANMTLFGAPKAYTTGFSSNNSPELGNPAYLRHNFSGQALPFSVDSGFEGYGFTATGKLRFATSGTYTFNSATDDSARLFIDDQQIFSNWNTKTTGATRNTLTGTFQVTTGKVYRFTYQYGHEGMSDLGSSELFLTGPSIAKTSNWSPYLQPGYNLANSSTVYDSILGNITTTTQYADPAYGLVDSITLDPTGLNYVGEASYETPGDGYLRQTSKTLPGGTVTEYLHYSATDVRDNPCTPETEAYPQAGFPKGTIDATGRSSETIYDNSGRVVASRYNNEPWSCLTYDARGRVTSTVIPDISGKSGRTITNNYAVTANPLITSVTDSSGTITTQVDLLGRTIRYVDTNGNETINTYDDFGKLTSRTSVIGTENYTYDQFDRLTTYIHDSTTYATVTYDQYSRIERVDYPAGLSLEPAMRDEMERVTRATYMAGSTELYDEVELSSSGLVVGGEENGVDKEYTYDKASRLTAATIGDDEFAYEFGAQDASCNSLSNTNANAAKNSNRTKLIKNGQTTTYCYNTADQLVASSDARFDAALYDSRGNTTSLGTGNTVTEFEYDVSDRSMGITETKNGTVTDITYTRDAGNRVISRLSKENNVTKSEEHYVYNGGGSAHSAIKDSNGIVQKIYLSLPGAVNVTISPTKQTSDPEKTVYSLSNMHGDIMATVGSDGAVIGVFITGPFGEALEQSTPVNSTTDTTFGYVGKHMKVTESSLAIGAIQMGARVYIPELGRFLQIDPVDGGTMNMYIYAMDPVNQFDLTGEFTIFAIFVARIVVAAVATAVAVIGWMSTPAYKRAAESIHEKIGKAMDSIREVLTTRREATIATKERKASNPKKPCVPAKRIDGKVHIFEPIRMTVKETKALMATLNIDAMCDTRTDAENVVSGFPGAYHHDAHNGGAEGYFDHYHPWEAKNHPHIWYYSDQGENK